MRQQVSRQPARERIKNFKEVSLGFTKKQAIQEARRCLQCKDPQCVKGCPVEIEIRNFIKLIIEGKPIEALQKIKEKNNLPAICGRVCPQEDQCEKLCILNKKGHPINIGALERYAVDYESETTDHPFLPKTSADVRRNFNEGGHNLETRQEKVWAKVAVVGSGPAGLTCAADLSKMGYQVIVFESLHLAGGVLIYGIPEFRLPKEIVENEVEYIRSLGVEIKTNTLIGSTLTIEDLFFHQSENQIDTEEDGFSAVFIATGAGLPQFLGILGENLNCVYSANEFLTRVNLMKAYKFPEYATPINIGTKVAVIGGGNVAFDCARVTLRLEKEVVLIYRRTEKEMPARLEEVQNAKDEGVMFMLLTQPVKIFGDEKGFVKGMECIKMQLGEPDESGRRRPIPIKNSNFILDVNTVIIAIGQIPNPLLPKVTAGLKTNADGTIWVDKKFMTSIPGVFAGGDIITGADTVISAMGAGKKAARAIDEYIKTKCLMTKLE